MTDSSTFKQYCVKCKQKRTIVDAKEQTIKTGQKALIGYCNICGTKILMFLEGKIPRLRRKPRSKKNRIGLPSGLVYRGKKFGRKGFLDEYGYERTRKMMETMSQKEISEITGYAPRTIRRAKRNLIEMARDQMTYQATNALLDQEAARRWYSWVQSRVKSTHRNVFHTVEDVWENVWSKKDLRLLNEQDIIDATNYIFQNKSRSCWFPYIQHLRYLIRFGLGEPSWLEKHLCTKGLKGEARIIPELMHISFFESLLPKMFSLVDQIPDQIQVNKRKNTRRWLISDEDREEFKLIFNSKITTGIRTGNRKKETELWGTRINAGKTALTYPFNHVMSWKVLAKRNERWNITHMPQRVKEMLRRHIERHSLGTRDYLIQMPATKANDMLQHLCEQLGISKLTLHDLRKTYITGLCLSGVPLEVAVDLNVGWKDLNTAKKYYLHIKALNAGHEYQKFESRFFA